MTPRSSALRASFGVILVFAASATSLFGYAVEGPSWPAGSTINQHLAFTGPVGDHLQDGFANFNASAADALNLWNQQIQLAKFAWTTSSIGGIQGDGQNTAFFSPTVYGQTYGSAIAVTVYFFDGSIMKEVDNVFDSSRLWDSYRGPLQYNSKKKQYILDFHRVAIHEFGHTLGLAHPDDYGQVVTAIMNSHISDVDHLADDDIAGVKWLYGLRITSDLIPYESPVGDNFSYQITANNDPTSFNATGLPSGLVLNSVTGLISGIPTVFGTFNVNVTATGPKGTASGIVTLTISAPAFVNLIGLPVWVGNSFSFKLIATGHPTEYEATGLPDGLQIDHQTGVISGQLIIVGDFSIQVTAHTPYGDANGIFPLHVFAPRITSASFLDDVFTGMPLSYQIRASTAQGTYAAIGLPAGLSVDSSTGMITGVPTLSGFYNIVIIAHTPYGDAKGGLQLTLTPPADKADIQLPISSSQPMLVDPIRSRLYLTDNFGTISVLDTKSFTIVGTIEAGFAHDLCLSADNSQLWVANSDEGSVTAYDATSLVPARTIAPGVRISNIREGVGQQMYILGIDTVSRVDLNSGAVTSVPWPGETDFLPIMEISADHKTLFVGNYLGSPSTLAKYDVSSGLPIVVQSVTQPDQGETIVTDPTSKRVCYVTNGLPTGESGTYYQIPVRSASDLNVTYGFLNPSTNQPRLLAFSADGKLLFELAQEALKIDVFDTQSMRLVRQINLTRGPSPIQMVVDRDNKYLFLSDPSMYTGYGLLGYLVNRPAPAPLTFPAHSLTNVSTRAFVGTSDNVEIGGFILHGTQSKKVVMRAIAPTLTSFGVAQALADPALEVRDAVGAVVVANDNWNAARQEVLATGMAPLDEHESVIITTLAPGNYTAVLRGLKNTTGVALFELYDLDPQNSKIANISTRGNVGTGDNVMIGGFIVGGDQPTNVIVRALGPTLTDFGVSGALADPTLELHDGNGAIISQNDNWKSTQQVAIQNSGYAPPKNAEAAILATLQPGNYTAIVRGKNNTTGVALVEVYNLDAN